MRVLPNIGRHQLQTRGPFYSNKELLKKIHHEAKPTVKLRIKNAIYPLLYYLGHYFHDTLVIMYHWLIMVLSFQVFKVTVNIYLYIHKKVLVTGYLKIK